MPKLTSIRKQALDDLMKEALFDASVSVMRTYGVNGLTMERVATEASVAKGSLYHYFRSKKELLLFVYTKITDPILLDLKEIVASPLSAIEKLSSHLHKLFENVGKHGRVFKMLFDDDMAHGLLQESERNSYRIGSMYLAEIFRQGIDEGTMQPNDPLLFAGMFLGLCRGIFNCQLPLEGSEQRESVHHLIMSSFLNGVATEKGRYS